jgi:hypothetical protein
MRKLLAIGLLLVAGLLCVTQQPRAQMGMTGVGEGGFGGTAAFQGPGDIVSYSVWGGLQAYSAATRGTPAARVCDTATGLTCVDFSTDAVTGKLVLQNVGGSSCSVIACSINKIYDQSGGNNCSGPCDFLTGGSVSTWPTLNTTGVGGNPTFVFTAASVQVLATGSTSFGSGPQPNSASAVAKSINTGTQQSLLLLQTSSVQLGFRASADNQASIYAGANITSTASDGAFHSLQAVWNGASSDINVDGGANIGNAGPDGVPATSQVVVGVVGGGSQLLNGEVGELGVLYGSAFSGATSSALSALAHSRWGF